MTANDKIKTLAALTGEPDTELLSTLLDIAGRRIVERAYPFVADKSRIPVPPRYDMLHVQLAQDMYNRRGAEGQTAHSENGVNRSYEDSDKLLSTVYQRGKVAGGAADISSATVASDNGTVTVTMGDRALSEGYDYVVEDGVVYGIVDYRGQVSVP